MRERWERPERTVRLRPSEKREEEEAELVNPPPALPLVVRSRVRPEAVSDWVGLEESVDDRRACIAEGPLFDGVKRPPALERESVSIERREAMLVVRGRPLPEEEPFSRSCERGWPPPRPPWIEDEKDALRR